MQRLVRPVSQISGGRAVPVCAGAGVGRDQQSGGAEHPAAGGDPHDQRWVAQCGRDQDAHGAGETAGHMAGAGAESLRGGLPNLKVLTPNGEQLRFSFDLTACEMFVIMRLAVRGLPLTIQRGNSLAGEYSSTANLQARFFIA